MAMMGLLTGSLFIARTGSLSVSFLGFTIQNKQLIMLVAGFMLMMLGLGYRFFSRKEQL